LRRFLPSGPLWRHAGFLRLWAAQTVSSFGARIAREGFAMTAILSIHATPAELGVLAALARGPGIVVGLAAGGFVDRTSRRQVMIGSDLARVALIFTVPLAAWWHVLAMMQLYLVAGLVGAAGVLFDIADHAFLPQLIDREFLLDGNAKLGVTDAVAEIGGPALAGTLFQLFTAPFAMLGTALTYLVSAAFLFAVPATELPPETPPEKPRWHRDAAEGFRAIMAEPLVRPIFWMTVVFTFFSSFFWPLYLIYGLKVLGLSPALMGVNIAMGGVGAVFAAGLSNRLARTLGAGLTMIGGFVAYGVMLALVPLAHGPLWLATTMLMTAQFFGDAFAMAAMIPMTTLRQAVLPQAMLGRTAALFGAASGGMTVLGAILGGVLGGRIGIRETLVISVAGVLASVAILIVSPLCKLKDIP
jgi:predicted MFS family arabinose efflux permease